MELQTERLKIVPCTNESLATYATKEYPIGSHIRSYLEKLHMKKVGTRENMFLWELEHTPICRTE